MKNVVFLLAGILLTFSIYMVYAFVNATPNVIDKQVSSVPNESNKTNLIVPNNENGHSNTTNTDRLDINGESTHRQEETNLEKKELTPDKIIENEDELYNDSPRKIQTIANIDQINEPSMDVLLLNALKVQMKIRAKEKQGLVKAKVSISHNMLTYAQAKKKGLKTNFITHIYGFVDKKLVYDASTSQFLSKNPLVMFSFHGRKSAMLTILYTQLDGQMYFSTKKIR